jgi:hypothetical protein
VTEYNSSIKEDKSSSIETLIERLKSYIETTIDLLKLKAIDKSMGFVSVLLSFLVVFVALSIFYILLNIGLALLIGELLGKSYYGFFIMAVVNAVAGFIVFKNQHKWIKNPLINKMVKEVLD